MISLKNECFKLTIDPQGATIVRFTTLEGTPILQSLSREKLKTLSKQTNTLNSNTSVPSAALMHSQIYKPDDTGGFPLLPIANRVKGNQYELNGEIVELDKNSPDGSEYLHGQGWQSLWQVIAQRTKSAALSLDFAHPSNGYEYHSEVSFTLNKNYLYISLGIKHLGTKPRLYGLGFHPYFAIEQQVDELKLNVTGYCPEIENHLAGICTEDIEPEFDYHDFKPISDSFVNHSYVGFNGLKIKRAALKQDNFQGIVSMDSDMPYLMMYHMPQSNFLALEPQTHCIDACNQVGRGGLKILMSPFDTLQSQLKISLD